jgi:hypothetical protein
MSAENSLSKDTEGFRWSFDEIRNIFVKGRNSGERVSSTGSFHWSFSGTLDAIRARFSSQEKTITEKTVPDQDAGGTSKKLRLIDESDRATRREDRREQRKGKSEKEKDRRNNVNNLFYTLGGLLGMEPGVKNKSQILSNAKEFLEQTNKGNSDSAETQGS